MDLKVLWTISNSMGTVSDIKMLKESKGFNIDVVTTDVYDKVYAGGMFLCKRYIVPSGNDSGYVKSIADICKEERITTIIPQCEDQLVPLSKNVDVFERMGVKVLVTEDTDMLDISNNKKRLYEFFKGYDFVPQYECGLSLDEIEMAVHELGYPYRSVCIKPVNGEGGKGFRIITMEQADMFDEQGASPKISWTLYKQGLYNAAAKIPMLLLMEYLPGREYSVDCVCHKGETIICIPRLREEVSMGSASVSTLEKNDELIEISRYIISRLKLSYNVNIQFKYSSSGRPKLIEINPRVSGSLIANYGGGVNMLEISLKTAYDMPLCDIHVDWGTRMIRYWDQVYVNKKGSILD